MKFVSILAKSSTSSSFTDRLRVTSTCIKLYFSLALQNSRCKSIMDSPTRSSRVSSTVPNKIQHDLHLLALSTRQVGLEPTNKRHPDFQEEVEESLFFVSFVSKCRLNFDSFLIGEFQVAMQTLFP